MTVMVAEDAAGAIASRRASAKAARGKVTSSTYSTYNTRTQGGRTGGSGRTGGASPAAPASAPAPSQGVGGTGMGPIGSQQATSFVRGVKLAPGDRGYQSVILAEFLAAVVIVALLPIASGGSDNAKAKGTPSPYDTGDLKQLVAIGGLYFILALASSGNSGRVSAWLGGLVLLGLAMKKLASPVGEKLQAIKGGVAQFGKTAGGAV